MPSAPDRLVPEAPGAFSRRKNPESAGKGRRATKQSAQGRKIKRARAVPERARGKGRASVKGATRNTQRGSAPRQPSLWFNRVLILFAAVVVLTAAAQAYIALDQLPVQRITVTGQLEHTQAEAVQEMVQASLAGGFLSADLQRMREQLQGLPWIFEATVRRRWPNALEIHVVEQLPIARWGEDSYLNHEGGIFRSENVQQGDALPLLRGPDGSAAALMARYQRLVEILAPLNLTVEQLSEDARGQLEAVLGGGMRLVIGGSDFRERMQRFVSIYREQLAAQAGNLARVDLRYSSGLAVAYRESYDVGNNAELEAQAGAQAQSGSSHVAGLQ
ncbi:MAG: cell division protein FtsQ/DivIB [Halioglobus sp.]